MFDICVPPALIDCGFVDPSVGLHGFSDALMSNGLFVGQALKWLPTWLTPIWVLGVGIAAGAVVAAAIFAVLAILSFIPGLGNIPDHPRRGVIASLILGIPVGLALCGWYMPQTEENAGVLVLPLMLLGLLAGFSVIYGMWHRTRSEWFSMLGEGVIPYVLGTLGVLALIGLGSTPLVESPQEILASVPAVNIFTDGVTTHEVEVPAASPDAEPDDAPFHPAEIEYNTRSTSELTIRSNRTVLLADADDPARFSTSPFRVDAGEVLEYRYEDRDTPPLPPDSSKLHIQNREIDPATVVFTFVNLPQIPQASSIVYTALAVVVLIAGLMVFRQAAPRVWALGLSTAKNEMAQPLYLILIALGVVGILFFGIYPFNTLGDDIRVLKDSGVTLIMVLAMLQAVWSAGTTVSEEIEGRTALTVLSKPVSRRAFVLGKYTGIMLTVLVMFLIMAAVLILVLSYKPIFEARELTKSAPVWQECHEQIMSVLPVLTLYFMETMVIGGIAVALATRLPLLANFITCFIVYVIGNLTSPLVASAQDNNELVGFVGKFIAVIVPNLNVFNVQAAVDTGNTIPPIYLAGAFNYLVVFVVAIWMLAMLLFEDRDLA